MRVLSCALQLLRLGPVEMQPVTPLILDQLVQFASEHDREIREVPKRRIRYPAALKPLIRRSTEAGRADMILLPHVEDHGRGRTVRRTLAARRPRGMSGHALEFRRQGDVFRHPNLRLPVLFDGRLPLDEASRVHARLTVGAEQAVPLLAIDSERARCDCGEQDITPAYFVRTPVR